MFAQLRRSWWWNKKRKKREREKASRRGRGREMRVRPKKSSNSKESLLMKITRERKAVLLKQGIKSSFRHCLIIRFCIVWIVQRHLKLTFSNNFTSTFSWSSLLWLLWIHGYFFFFFFFLTHFFLSLSYLIDIFWPILSCVFCADGSLIYRPIPFSLPFQACHCQLLFFW